MLIRNKYSSFHLLKTCVPINLEIKEINRFLKIVHDYVERLITEPLCTSYVYGSKKLDDICLRVGGNNLKLVMKKPQNFRPSRSEHPIFVYIVTKLQKSGGHTKIIKDFIKTQNGGKHFILSTELDGKSDSVALNDMTEKHNNIVLEKAPKGNYQKRLVWLQKRLIEIAPKKTYLFNHHQDSVAVAAIQPEMNLDATFYHHGDHHICLGVYLSHLKHIDPHPMGYYNCRSNLGIENIYVPLTFEDKGARPEAWPFRNNNRLITCTAARSNKIEIPYFVSYLDIVPLILKSTGGTHIHIGRLSPWALYRIRQGLKRIEIQPEQFVYIPWVPSVWKSLQENRVDLYVASFPYGGGLTLIEAMGAGIPLALHKHIFSRVLSGIDLAYPGVFNWRYPEELLNFCSTVTANELKEASNLGRMQFEKFHKNKYLDRFLNDDNYDILTPDELSSSFFVEADEWALWMERQVSLSHLILRTFYRLYRYFRSNFIG